MRTQDRVLYTNAEQARATTLLNVAYQADCRAICSTIDQVFYMRALRKVGISRTPTRHTPVRLRLLKKSFFGRSSQWHAAIRTTINRSSSFASNKFIVNSVCCSRALVSGPTSKVLASGGGLGSGQLLMM